MNLDISAVHGEMSSFFSSFCTILNLIGLTVDVFVKHVVATRVFLTRKIVSQERKISNFDSTACM